ncbi:MAG TPA: ATP-binding cassette domain-containing protein [Methanothrix sp.]|uniref:ABC transporter ATP-binding protein n=1 Tax=Methanothrix sp. TaxID=90426 RepID=UPI002CFE6D4E|nr:ATP-binding cassette domain-containing protein [Methanothrix sp.]MDI9417556.1 ATP-binding cassette domain-containing protein [Euryarchaeota archaeon]HON35413.1 ATP-binding cassette domain-containing protein [Methanothrix sp.]HRU75887.1 ATP-binding cassette domain-containing protein [Methanothrix sp.]
MACAIDVRQLSKLYNGGIKALDGLDLRVKAAKVFAFLGPNGSGKTTLMRILTTQIRPTSGSAYIFGLDTVKSGQEIRKIIGYVPQETSVWLDISGYENLLIYSKIYGVPSKMREKRIQDTLQSMGIEEVADRMVKSYSGGMVRRLEIACALLVGPRILFLDEPTIGLDPSARKAVWENLISFKQEYGTTVFFNTHYMDEADLYSDEIAIIDKGRIVKSGTASELKQSLRSEIIQVYSHDRIGGRVLESIRDLAFVQGVIDNNSHLEIIVGDSETRLPLILDLLRGEGISLERICTAKPTLDDVFLNYAGAIHLKCREEEERGSKPVQA